MLRGIWRRLKRTHEGEESCDGTMDTKELDDDLRTSKRARFEDNVEKTPFPDFGVPDLEEVSDVDEDDEPAIAAKEELYRTKEDEDVAVFLRLAGQMSMKSLLFLLQGQARAQQNLPEVLFLKKYEQLVDAEMTDSCDEAPQKPVSKKKQFRFAEVSGEEVRVVVHSIESYKDMKELWWSQEEMHGLRCEAVRAVKYFRNCRPEYIGSVLTVAKAPSSVEPGSPVEEHMRKLTEDSFARGLESHIVSFLSDHRKATVQAVLQEQDECKLSGDDYEMTSHCLREQSLAYSAMSTRFSHKMAQCDQIDALKASMSRWRAEQAATGTFWVG